MMLKQGEIARRLTAAARSVLPAIIVLAAYPIPASAQDGPPGITEPTVFPPFDPAALSCGAPPGLEKVLAFARDNDRDFMLGVDRGLAAAAKDRGLEYRVEVADNDPGKMIEQVDGLRAALVGGMVVAPVDPASVAPSLQQAISHQHTSAFQPCC